VTIDTTKLRPYKNNSLPTIDGGLNTFLAKELAAISAASAQIAATLKLTAAEADAIIAGGLVTNIAGNSGAFTLNSASGITNTANDIKLSQASASQFGAVKVDNTTITAAAGVISAVSLNPAPIKASLGADVALNSGGSTFTGPSIAQGSTGTWFASGTVTITDSATGQYDCKLWDGTTVIASTRSSVSVATSAISISLSGYIVSPAANIKISVTPTGATGTLRFNITGNSKDSTISAFRIA
jgi:hypothetical protein